MNREAVIGLVAIVAAAIAFIATGSFTSAIMGFFGAGLIALVVVTILGAMFR